MIFYTGKSYPSLTCRYKFCILVILGPQQVIRIQPTMLNWNQVFKSWTGAPVLILSVLIVFWLSSGSSIWQFKFDDGEIEESHTRNTEILGGDTPEETFDLFIDALKKENVELGSKYFVAEKQDGWFKILSEYKKIETLDDFVKELEHIKTIWREVDTDKSELAVFKYEDQNLEFHKNQNGIWSIYDF